MNKTKESFGNSAQEEARLIAEIFQSQEEDNGWRSIGFRPLADGLLKLINGWGGRIRTHEWRYQKPLPYRLATPQSHKLNKSYRVLNKDTTKILAWAIVLSIFLFFATVAYAKPAITHGNQTKKYETKKLIKQNNGSAINVARAYRDGILYSSMGQLYFNLDAINLIGSVAESSDLNGLKINNIIVDGKDFYLASDIGVFKNYRRIFSGEECFHLEKTKKRIFISCQSGIYQAELNKKSFNNFNFNLLATSPQASNFFTLNRSKTRPLYATAINGFYFFDRKAKWQKRNFNLGRNFAGQYEFARFVVIREKSKKDIIALALADGFYLSNNEGKTWLKSSQGLEANIDGFYDIYEIKIFNKILYLASSTGLYQAQLPHSFDKTLKLNWQKIDMYSLRKSENNNRGILSIDFFEDSILAASAQGEIVQILEKAEFKAELVKEEIIDLENRSLIDELLACEPRIQDLHKNALAFAGIPVGKTFKKYRTRARIRNFLPEFQAYLERDSQDFLSFEAQAKDSFNSATSSITTSLDESSTEREDSQLNTGLRLTWRLGNLLFDPEINDINNSARLIANIRENLLTEVTQIYYQRKELLFHKLNQVLNEQGSVAYKDYLQLEELLAELDARTGAWFAEDLASRLKITMAEIEDPALKNIIREIYKNVEIN